MMSVDDYEHWFAERDKAFKYLDNLPTRDLPYSDEEVEADIEQAIREVLFGIQIKVKALLVPTRWSASSCGPTA